MAMRTDILGRLSAVACVALAGAAAVPALADGCAVSMQPPQLQRASGAPGDSALAVSARPHVGRHGQLLYGQDPYYLTHLAVIMVKPDEHPHSFQVVLEAAFDDPAAEAAYLDSRRANPAEIHTAVPQVFDQMALVTDEPGRRLVRTLPDTAIDSGHVEQGGQAITAPTELSVDRMVYFREFFADGAKLERPGYLLF
jgi:hypothetical protein